MDEMNGRTTGVGTAGRMQLIGVPSSAGARRTGQELGPAALRAAGLTETLMATGWDVQDPGDPSPIPFRPDPDHPHGQNLDAVVDVARRTAARVRAAVEEGRLPLVVGGDCSLSLGVIAGLLERHPRLGVVYFDADLDLNTPETTISGAGDSM